MYGKIILLGVLLKIGNKSKNSEIVPNFIIL